MSITADSYWGIGYVSYPAERVYTKGDGGDVTETLQDVIDASVKEFKFSQDQPPEDASQYKEGTVWFVYQ
ncbi:MAG: hypothetical protein K9L56_14065 [Clostridiales bacterium]|nr:hypothetical protein [Clostridiales bacterium]